MFENEWEARPHCKDAIDSCAHAALNPEEDQVPQTSSKTLSPKPSTLSPDT